MRTIQLRSLSHAEPEFAAVNNDRREIHTSIEFFRSVCDCGAVGLYALEAAHGDVGDLNNLVMHTTRIECPGGCGSSYQIMTPRAHCYHGVKLTLLESWREDVEVNGFDKDTPSTAHKEPSEADIIMGAHSRGRNDYIQIYRDRGGQIVFRLEVMMPEHQVTNNDVRNEIRYRVSELLHNYPRSWLP